MRDQSGKRSGTLVSLTELEGLSFTSESGRIGELARIQKDLESLPLLVPAKGRYIIELKNDGFHLYGVDHGITRYAMDPKADLNNISEISGSNGDIKIRFARPDGGYSVTIHSEPYHSAREGYFRPSQLHSPSASAESRSYGSESGGARDGER